MNVDNYLKISSIFPEEQTRRNCQNGENKLLKFLKNLFTGLFCFDNQPAEGDWNADSWTYCDCCKSIFFTKDLKNTKRFGKSYRLCRRCSKPETLKKFLYACDICKELVTDGSLTEFDSSVLCRKCFEEHIPTCPECGKKIASDNIFYTTHSQTYCRPCARKLKLKKYSPSAYVPEKDAFLTSGEEKVKNTEYIPVLSIDINVSSGRSSLKISDRPTIGTPQRSPGTVWETAPFFPDFSQGAKSKQKSKPIFSHNNYYHPEFDDNLEDDFVSDGIGGLDDKHDT